MAEVFVTLFAFAGGLAVMWSIWLIHDLKNSPYMKGYSDGLRDGIQEVLNDFPSLRGAEQNEQTD